jgi:hypothetical protein
VLEYLNQRDSLVWVLLQKLVDQIFVLLGDLALEGDLRTGLVAGNGLLIPTKGSVSVDKLVKQNSEGPHVQLVIMLPVIYHFWSHVLESTAKSVSLSLVRLALRVRIHLTLASPAKVANL